MPAIPLGAQLASVIQMALMASTVTLMEVNALAKLTTRGSCVTAAWMGSSALDKGAMSVIAIKLVQNLGPSVTKSLVSVYAKKMCRA